MDPWRPQFETGHAVGILWAPHYLRQNEFMAQEMDHAVGILLAPHYLRRNEFTAQEMGHAVGISGAWMDPWRPQFEMDYAVDIFGTPLFAPE